MAFRQSDSVEVKRIKGKGRGVFARRAIARGEVIERLPVLVMTSEEYAEGLSKTPLKDYCFAWGEDQVALALGYGSLYNHSYRPNARYEDIAPTTKAFVAVRAIAAGEEITVNYNGKPGSRAKVWFDVLEGRPRTFERPRGSDRGSLSSPLLCLPSPPRQREAEGPKIPRPRPVSKASTPPC